MGVSYDAPFPDSAYKLVAVGDRLVIKLSPGKVTLPGSKQVFRVPAGTAMTWWLCDEPPPGDRRRLLARSCATASGWPGRSPG